MASYSYWQDLCTSAKARSVDSLLRDVYIMNSILVCPQPQHTDSPSHSSIGARASTSHRGALSSSFFRPDCSASAYFRSHLLSSAQLSKDAPSFFGADNGAG
jgi:hypothetical protein